MRKILICCSVSALLFLTACSTTATVDDVSYTRTKGGWVPSTEVPPAEKSKQTVTQPTPRENTEKAGVSSLDELKQLSSKPRQQVKGINSIRRRGLEDTAMGVGAQSGLAKRAGETNAMLEADAENLDNVFNFHALILNDNILPPVLTEGRTTLNQSDDRSVRVADVVYRIERQARFATAPPNWRDYLWMSYTDPEVPNHTLLPQNPEEKQIWKDAVTNGWNEGIMQANAIFNENLARLHRDYKGMILYRRLLAQNMVSPPYIAKTELGITGDSNEMHVNDQVLRITALPGLTTDSKQWKPVLDAPGYDGTEPVKITLDEEFKKVKPGKFRSGSDPY